jgi:hypothetical protein
MITSFEVGSVFKIVDQGSPAIKKLYKAVAELDTAVEAARKNVAGLARTRLVGVSNQFKALTKEVGLFDRSIMGAAATIGRMSKASQVFAAVGTEIAGVTVEVGALAKEWGGLALAAGDANREMRAASRVRGPNTTALVGGTDAATASATKLADVWTGVANEIRGSAAGARLLAGATMPAIAGSGGGTVPGGRRPGRHGPGQSFHVSGLSTKIPGGHAHFRGGGNTAMAAAGALAYGVYEEAELEDAVFQMKWHAGLPNTSANSKYFRDLIQSTASQTGFGYKEIAEAATDEIRLLKGADGKESGGLAILPEMLRAAALESKVKPGTSLQSAMTSLVEMAHMAQEYGIDDIKGMAPLLGFLSTTNPATTKQMVSAASYAIPTLHSALNMDPADVLYETTAIARAGATNTKSGTWVRAAFERALPPDPNVTGDKEYAMRIYAMQKLGMVDGNGKSTILDPTGKHIDIAKLLRVERENADKLPIAERNAYEKKVFGETGSRGIDLMKSPAVVAQTEELKKEFPEFKGRYETFFEDYEKESPIQKARETWEDLTNVLSDIGTVALPPLIVGLRGLDDILKSIGGNWPDPGKTFGIPEKGTLGDALGKGMAEGGIVGGIGGFFIGGVGAPLGAAIGALIGGTYEGGKYLLGGTAPVKRQGSDASGSSDRSAGSVWNPISPPQKIDVTPSNVTVKLGERTVGEAVVNWMVAQGNGPTQGSPYPDTTRGGSTFDFSLVN